MAKVATRIKHIAADELCPIRKILALLDHDLAQDQNLEVAREAVRVHVPLLVRDHGRALDLDPSLDPDPEAFRDREAAQHPGQDQARRKAGQDRGRARVKAVHDQGLIVAHEEAARRQDQDQGQVREKAIPGQGRGHQMVQGKARRVQDLDLKAALVRAQKTANREVRVDRGLNRSLSQDPNQDREAAANRDRVPDQRAVLEVGVRADQRGKCSFYIILFL